MDTRTIVETSGAGRDQIVLLGEDVDVDVDEPSISIRWAFVACGEAFLLPGSQGVHGSEACGLPGMPLDIYIDRSAMFVACRMKTFTVLSLI